MYLLNDTDQLTYVPNVPYTAGFPGSCNADSDGWLNPNKGDEFTLRQQ